MTLTGNTGVGSEADPNAPAAQAPATQAPAPATQAPATQAPATQAPAAGSTPAPTDGAVALPSDVHGQTAAQYTCSKPFSE